ncbi:3-dehydroquinate synthase [bacterium]|nr:3-dehydroquinate synthase [bacterium]
MNTLQVNLSEHSYTIFFSHNSLEELPALFQQRFQERQLFFIINTIVADLYEAGIRSIFKASNNRLHIITIADGEDSKNLTTAEKIFTELIQNGADRKSVIIGFGGGVVGDIAGFAASTYMRGVSFVQIPTTLLAMVDSSVGGKVAVNHELAKNMIGAFYQPKFVFIDDIFLRTLPRREIICGLAEIMKYGLILDKTFFEWTAANYEKLFSFDKTAVEYAVRRSCELKAQVVEKDEKENEIRVILNFGHTWAHAFENLGNYRILKHGEAVFVGMLAASHVSWMNYRLNDEEFKEIEKTLLTFLKEILADKDIMQFLESVTWDRIWSKMLSDKKASQNTLRWVLLNRIGEAATEENIDPARVEKSFVYLKSVIRKTDHVIHN